MEVVQQVRSPKGVNLPHREKTGVGSRAAPYDPTQQGWVTEKYSGHPQENFGETHHHKSLTKVNISLYYLYRVSVNFDTLL
jgi:hypothetical protein